MLSQRVRCLSFLWPRTILQLYRQVHRTDNMGVCVCERDRQTERRGDRGRERKRKRLVCFFEIKSILYTEIKQEQYKKGKNSTISAMNTKAKNLDVKN